MAEQVERVQKNRQSYYNKVMEIQMMLAQQNKVQVEAQTKLQMPAIPKTTLNLPTTPQNIFAPKGVYGQEGGVATTMQPPKKKKRRK